MINPYCTNCNYKKYKINGNCSRQDSPDKYSMRCAPPWTSIKHKFVEGYCEIVTKAMINQSFQMCYIDLYSGPGKYFQRPSGQIFDGSPLIANKYAFNKYIFIDINHKNIEALRARVDNQENKYMFEADSNSISDDINEAIPSKSLSFCLADPENMRQLKFSTLMAIVSNKKVDLLINFPYWMDFKRAAKELVTNNSTDNPLDLYFGTDEWKKIFNAHAKRFTDGLFIELLELYLSQFYKIGYVPPSKGLNYEIIKNTRNRPIYLLLFLSKNKLGYKFWSEIVKYTKEITLSFDFG